MRSSKSAPLHAAMVLALVVSGAVSGTLRQEARADASASGSDRGQGVCASRDAVADFVCRNTWLANTRHSYR